MDNEGIRRKAPDYYRLDLRTPPETEPVFPAGNISIGARQIGVLRGVGLSKEQTFGAQRGGSQGGEIFLSPPSCAFFGAFFAQAKKAEDLKRKKEQSITRQIRRFAGDGQCKGNGLPRAFHALAMTDTENANLRGMDETLRLSIQSVFYVFLTGQTEYV